MFHMANNLTVKFFLKLLTHQSAKDKAPVAMRLTLNRKKSEFNTGYNCAPAQFDANRQRAKKDHAINRGLSRMEEKAFEIRDQLVNDGKPISAATIRDHLLGRNKSDQSLLAFYRDYLSRASTDGLHASSTLVGYEHSYNHLEGYIKSSYQDIEIGFDHINYEFIKSFDHSLKTYITKQGDGRLKPGTIHKIHGHLRSVLIEAENRQLMDRNPYRSFKLNAPTSKPKYLTKEELARLENLDLREMKSLDKVRDLFVFRCYTGLRDDDARHLMTNHVVEKKGKPYIEVEQRKTKDLVQVPILPKAMAIIDKYKSCQERQVLGLLLPKISNQKQNAYLKVLADFAGIEKNITTHVARHTCASTVLIANGVDLKTAGRWLGQKSIKSTEVYGHVDTSVLDDIADKLSEV